MRMNSPGTALMMKRASLGPAAAAARVAHMQRIRDGYLPLPTHFSNLLAAGGSMGALGSLGDAAPLKQAGAAVAGKVAGAAATAQFAAYGAWAGPIGIAVGAIVGLALGKVLNKQYLDVNQMNANEDKDIAAFNQYLQVMGQFAGRSVGIEGMKAVWIGANHSGYFPLNNGRQCFHNGCSKYPGNEGWIHGTIFGGRGTHATFPQAYQQFAAAKSAGTLPGVIAPMPATSGPMAVPTPRIGMRLGRETLAGLGDPAAPIPDAKIFVDSFYIPLNRVNSPPWAVPRNATEYQILYDVADAWLAQQPIQTVPYIAQGNTQPVNTPGTLTQADPTQGGTPAGPGTLPATGGPGGGSNVGNTYSLAPVTNPQTGQTQYQLTDGKGATPPSAPITAGLSNIPNSVWLMLLAGFALAMPLQMKQPRRRRR